MNTGEVDIDDLEKKLQDEREHNSTRMIIGLFSAASNVSGTLNQSLNDNMTY